MRDPLAPIIRNLDLSGMVNRWSFECEPFFTDATESATMLDGATVHDVFPLKARFSWTLNSLSAEQYAALNAAFARDTVAAQIFDPTINAVRLARFHVTRPTFVYNFATQHYMSTDGSALVLEDAAPRALPAVTPSPRPVVEPRDPLAPVIENYDLSGTVSRYSLQCEPFTTDGDNGGTLQDGSTVLDVLADKFRLSWTLNAISARQYAGLCAALSAGTAPDTVSATVYNPVLNAEYTTLFHVTFPVFRFAFDNGQCMAYADSALVLEEASKDRGLPVAGDVDWTLYDDGTLEIDPLPDGSPETEDDRWRRILQALDTPAGNPNAPIQDVERIQLNPNIPSLPSGIPEQFPNLDTIVIPPNVEIPPDEFDNCPSLTVIKIVSYPFKADYVAGEPLDYNGLCVVQIYDGAERDITAECVLLPAEGYMTSAVEDIMVDVRYQDKSLGTFWVSVQEISLRAIWIETYPQKMGYDFGDTLDYTGLVVRGELDDGTTRDVTSFCTFSPEIGTSVALPDGVEIPNVEDYRQLEIKVQCGQERTSFSVDGPMYYRRLATGTLRIVRPPEGDFDTFVSKFKFGIPSDAVDAPPQMLRFIEYEYRIAGSDPQKEIRRIEASETGNGVYHIVQIEEAVPMQEVEYNIYLYEPNTQYSTRNLAWGAFFMAFPYTRAGKTYLYPGTPELVLDWLVRTYRGDVPEGDPEIIAYGDFWTMYDTGLLDIHYTGDMPNYGSSSSPWYYQRTRITNITISNGTTSIGRNAFRGCANLISINIPNSVTSIGMSAFYGCSSLTSVTIPDSVTNIESSVFIGCSSLTNVTIPDSVTQLNGGLFQNCSNLTSVTISNSITTIGGYTFYRCTSLTNVIIPSGVTSIGGGAFSGCTSLRSVTIPDSVTYIYFEAFSGCNSFTDVYYTGTEAQWNTITIDNDDNAPLFNATIHYNSTGS